ncbi:radical SAM protein [candidate division KSB1 bacterium]|nr:radical SAM protein [candidate division KSB1 bacterium]
MKNNIILLVNPWIYDFAAYDFWIKPMGLLSIGSILEHFGYKTFLIDCMDRFHPLILKKSTRGISPKHKYGTGKFLRQVVEKPEMLSDIPRKYCRYGMPMDTFNEALSNIPQPDVILVTSMMTYWYPGPFKAIELLRQAFPKTRIILGGIYATLYHEHAEKYSGADVVITGPGERQALQLVDQITGNESDWNLFPEKWSEMPEPSYRYYNTLASVPVMTSRGCPYRCSFCASYLLCDTFEQKEPQRILEHIEYHYRKRHVNQFAFFDDALLVNKEAHIKKILEGCENRSVHVNFHTPNGLHAGKIDAEIAQIMFKTNFKTIRLSYETSNKARQKEMLHKVSDDALSNALDHLENAGYARNHIDVYVIMGLPGQELEEVVDSMIFVNSLGAKVRLTSFSPIPNTVDWNRAVTRFEMEENPDPLLTNNTIFPLKNERQTYDQFQNLRNLSKVLNYALDQDISLFRQTHLNEIFYAAMNKYFKLNK